MKNTNSDFITLQAVYEHSNSGGDDPWILGSKFHIRLDSVNEIGSLESHSVFESWNQFRDLTNNHWRYWADDNSEKLPHAKIAKICKSTPIGLGINGTRHYVWVTEKSYRSLCKALNLEVLE